MTIVRAASQAGRAGLALRAKIDRQAQSGFSPWFGSLYQFWAFDPDGNLKWYEYNHNLVVNAGLNDLLDKYFKGSTYTAAFYVGLTDGTPTVAAGDTMALHAGWAEVTAYDEANRQALTLGSVSGQAVNNGASKATFTIDTNSTTIGGAFLTTNSTKGGTTGILYGAAAFTGGDKTLDDGDTLAVQINLSAAAA